MQAPKEAPLDMQSKDKFLIQSTIAPDGATSKDLSPELVGLLNVFCIILYFINVFI